MYIYIIYVLYIYIDCISYVYSIYTYIYTYIIHIYIHTSQVPKNGRNSYNPLESQRIPVYTYVYICIISPLYNII